MSWFKCNLLYLSNRNFKGNIYNYSAYSYSYVGKVINVDDVIVNIIHQMEIKYLTYLIHNILTEKINTYYIMEIQ